MKHGETGWVKSETLNQSVQNCTMMREQHVINRFITLAPESRSEGPPRPRLRSLACRNRSKGSDCQGPWSSSESWQSKVQIRFINFKKKTHRKKKREKGSATRNLTRKNTCRDEFTARLVSAHCEFRNTGCLHFEAYMSWAVHVWSWCISYSHNPHEDTWPAWPTWRTILWMSSNLFRLGFGIQLRRLKEDFRLKSWKQIFPSPKCPTRPNRPTKPAWDPKLWGLCVAHPCHGNGWFTTWQAASSTLEIRKS